MATLIVVEGPAKGGRFALEQHRIAMIGRESKCTFQILDPRISRLHMQIKLDEGTSRHSAVDFQSALGVFINGTRISAETPLSDGDQIKIGDSTILYTTDDATDAKKLQELLRKRGENVVTTWVK
jgi:pSer/pThr/pTyr-binding forkhead associated (FHA) protein